MEIHGDEAEPPGNEGCTWGQVRLREVRTIGVESEDGGGGGGKLKAEEGESAQGTVATREAEEIGAGTVVVGADCGGGAVLTSVMQWWRQPR